LGLGPGDAAALLAGECDPRSWPGWRGAGSATSSPSCARHYAGASPPTTPLLLRLALEHVEQLERSIAELDAEVDRAIAPFAPARDRLDTITGVGKRAAESISA
jgi:transposase